MPCMVTLWEGIWHAGRFWSCCTKGTISSCFFVLILFLPNEPYQAECNHWPNLPPPLPHLFPLPAVDKLHHSARVSPSQTRPWEIWSPQLPGHQTIIFLRCVRFSTVRIFPMLHTSWRTAVHYLNLGSTWWETENMQFDSLLFVNRKGVKNFWRLGKAMMSFLMAFHIIL